jgi:G3E family GTPase
MTKVHVVSGFLGAGKTTFIKKLLGALKDEKIVILENEFGEVGIDGDIIKGSGFDVIELEQGCICCSLKINFMDAILKIVDSMNPDHIIVEPTGIGLLSEIINIMKNDKIREKCTLNSLITIIDSVNYLDQLDGFGDFFRDQIRCASTLILSKTTEVTDDVVDKTLNSLKELNSDAYIITDDWKNFSHETLRALLAGELNKDIESIEAMEDYHLPHDISSISVAVVDNLSKDKLENILNELSTGDFGQVLRGKGFIKNEGKILEFNYVNGQYIINRSHLKDVEKICFIGKGLKKEEIKMLFN